MYFTDNPVADADRYENDREEWLKKRPCCSECGEHIQDEFAYYIAGDWICDECMEKFRKSIPED